MGTAELKGQFIVPDVHWGEAVQPPIREKGMLSESSCSPALREPDTSSPPIDAPRPRLTGVCISCGGRGCGICSGKGIAVLTTQQQYGLGRMHLGEGRDFTVGDKVAGLHPTLGKWHRALVEEKRANEMYLLDWGAGCKTVTRLGPSDPLTYGIPPEHEGVLLSGNGDAKPGNLSAVRENEMINA